MSQQKLRRLLWGILLLVLGGITAAGLWRGVGSRFRTEYQGQRALEGLDVLGAVPDFSLTEQHGKPYGLAALKGKTWIANFMYTSCKDTCPLQTAALAKLQDALPKNDLWRLVSVSVDPDHDTPEILTRYAARFGADTKRWFFLTGDKKAIYRLAQQGFRLSAVPASGVENDQSGIVLHSSRLVLVDDRGRIRGYYDSQDAEAVKRLERDMNQLIKAMT